MFKLLHPFWHVQELCPSRGQKDPWFKDILGMILIVAVVQSLSHAQLFATSWTAAHQAPLFFTISQSFLRFMSTELVMLPNHLILCHSLLLPSVFPSIRIWDTNTLATQWELTETH